jgi:hypothetical protein
MPNTFDSRPSDQEMSMPASEPSVGVKIREPALRSRTAVGVVTFFAIPLIGIALTMGLVRLVTGQWLDWTGWQPLPVSFTIFTVACAAVLLVVCFAAAAQFSRVDVEVRKEDNDILLTAKRWFFMPRIFRYAGDRVRGARWIVRVFRRDASDPGFRSIYLPRVQLVRGHGSVVTALGIGLTVSEAQVAADALNRVLDA